MSQFHSICFRSARILIWGDSAQLTEILQLMSMPSMPGIPDMPGTLMLMALEAVEVEGISMVIDAGWSILGGSKVGPAGE